MCEIRVTNSQLSIKQNIVGRKRNNKRFEIYVSFDLIGCFNQLPFKLLIKLVDRAYWSSLLIKLAASACWSSLLIKLVDRAFWSNLLIELDNQACVSYQACWSSLLMKLVYHIKLANQFAYQASWTSLLIEVIFYYKLSKNC